jgi:hypothetical protein
LIVTVIVVNKIETCVARENVVVNLGSRRACSLLNSYSINIILNRVVEDLNGIGAGDYRLKNSNIIILDYKTNQTDAFRVDRDSCIT